MDQPPVSIGEQVRGLRERFERSLAEAGDRAALQALRDAFLGRRSGAVTALLRSLGGLGPEARRAGGQLLNDLKASIETRLGEALAELEGREGALRLQAERLDVSLPGRRAPRGLRHPLTRLREELEDVFLGMGYEVYDGPEVDDDFHCFEALNMPPDHPARDMQDTFYVADGGGLLLRTHTSTSQIRYMLANQHPPDVRIICPGKVYRRDEEDASHSSMFQQIEGLVVGRRITLGDLKGTIEAFVHVIFGAERPVRFRSSYFPYTEPSVETDLGCAVCGGAGETGGDRCRMCKGTGWLEILGSGMVHPAVFEAVNARLGRTVYDPEKVSGFAFGLGIERVALMRHAIDDIRLFYAGDQRFLEQFDR